MLLDQPITFHLLFFEPHWKKKKAKFLLVVVGSKSSVQLLLTICGYELLYMVCWIMGLFLHLYTGGGTFLLAGCLREKLLIDAVHSDSQAA